jgi:hypothetical protein
MRRENPFENARHRRIILKLILKKLVERTVVDVISWLRAGQWSVFVNTAMNSGVQHQAKCFLSRWATLRATLRLSEGLRNTTAYLTLYFCVRQIT